MKNITPFARPALFLLAATSSMLTHSGNSQACGAPSCQQGDSFPTEGRVPQNALAWFFRPSYDHFDESDAGTAVNELRVFVVAADGGDETETELALTAGEAPPANSGNGTDELWLPATDVPAGTTLRVETSFSCGHDVESSYITVIEAAPIPPTLGTLKVETKFDSLDIWTASGSCTEPVKSKYADVEVKLSEGAAPFADVLRYSLLVDGERYRNTDWIWTEGDGVALATLAGSALGVGKERAFSTCATYEELEYDGDEGVEPTKHDLQMQALLPDGTVLLSDVVTVDLTCPCGARNGGVDCQANSTDSGVDGPSHNDDLAVSPRSDKRESGCAVAFNASTPSGSMWFAALLGFAFCFRSTATQRMTHIR